MNKQSLLVIDPSTNYPEIEAFNCIAKASIVPVSYHLPAMFGPSSMQAESENALGIIVMGSATSVHENPDWMNAISNVVTRSIDNKIPVLGICFGHQLLAHMYGGMVDFLWEKEKKRGQRIVHLRSNRLWGAPQSGPMLYSHNEGVVSCPAEFEITASSDMVSMDGIAHKTKPIWGFQPHIEASSVFADRCGVKGDLYKKVASFGGSILGAFYNQIHNDEYSI